MYCTLWCTQSNYSRELTDQTVMRRATVRCLRRHFCGKKNPFNLYHFAFNQPHQLILVWYDPPTVVYAKIVDLKFPFFFCFFFQEVQMHPQNSRFAFVFITYIIQSSMNAACDGWDTAGSGPMWWGDRTNDQVKSSLRRII